MSVRSAVLLILAASPAIAQFDLQVSDALGTRSAPAVYDLGAIYAAETASARFLLRNSSTSPATVGAITAGGPGFSVTTPTLPAIIEPDGALPFQVNFQASDTGSYSAVLRAGNATILLLATVRPRLTYRVDDAALGSGVNFGNVDQGSAATRRVTASNETGTILIVPAISVTGIDYLLAGPPVSGISLSPHQSVEFTLEFRPSAAGPQTGTLIIGDRSYPLTGIGAEPPLPKPMANIQLGQAASAQQGTLIVNFDHPATAGGAGTATLEFDGPSDPAIAFAAGGRTATFAIAPGDVRATLPFQTGTSAGTLAFRVRIGGSEDAATVTIAKAAPVLTAVEGSRYGSSLEIRITGFDNSRTAGPLAFTFFDSTGQEIAPGAIRADASANFARYFGASDAGGTFVLRAMFPVTGDASRIVAFEVALSGSAGSAKSARVLLP